MTIREKLGTVSKLLMLVAQLSYFSKGGKKRKEKKAFQKDALKMERRECVAKDSLV